MIKQKLTEKENNVFFVVDVFGDYESQLRYAMAFCNKTQHNLILYPLDDSAFDEGVYELSQRKKNIHLSGDLWVKVCKDRIGFRRSLNVICINNRVSYLMITVVTSTLSFKQRVLLGADLWGMVNDVSIPVLLIPHGAVFTEFEELTIAVDSSSTFYRIPFVKKMSHRFGTMIHIFVKKPMDNNQEESRGIARVKGAICDVLTREHVSYQIIESKLAEDFDLHLIRYARQHTQLLVLEIDSVQSSLKENLQKYLLPTHGFVVLLIKPKEYGRVRWFGV